MASSEPDAPAAGLGDQEATGFWRLARPPAAQRPWLVSPEGRPVFLLAVNTVMRDVVAHGVRQCAGIGDYIRRDAPGVCAQLEWARLSDDYGFNSVGAFSEPNDFDDTRGDSYMIRPRPEGAGAPYAVTLDVAARGDDRALKDQDGNPLLSGFSAKRVGDPYNPAFLADLDAVAAKVRARRDDPRLQMWFAGNEIGIFDVAGHKLVGVRDLRRWLWSDVPAGSTIDAPRCVRHALAAFLRDRYGASVDKLNRAWASTYADFPAIVSTGPLPVPYVQACNDRAAADLQRFVHDELLPRWVRAVSTCIRGADPNHLVASPRLAIAGSGAYRFWTGPPAAKPDQWAEAPGAIIPADAPGVRYSPFDVLGRDGDSGFDLVAVNAYSGAAAFEEPWFTDGLTTLATQSGLPLLISEFSIRARIEGWTGRGGAGSFVPAIDAHADQVQRGVHYGAQMGQFVAQREVVGAAWHAWSDRFRPTDPSAKASSAQINMGIVQCTDPDRGLRAGDPWVAFASLVAESNATILERIAATTGL